MAERGRRPVRQPSVTFSDDSQADDSPMFAPPAGKGKSAGGRKERGGDDDDVEEGRPSQRKSSLKRVSKRNVEVEEEEEEEEEEEPEKVCAVQRRTPRTRRFVRAMPPLKPGPAPLARVAERQVRALV